MRRVFASNRTRISDSYAPKCLRVRTFQMPLLVTLALVLVFTLFFRPATAHAGALAFGDSRNFGSGLDDTWSVALGDLDGDGDLDIVAGNDGQNAVYMNAGDGNFPPADARVFGSADSSTVSVALGDVDADGDLDIVAGNKNQQNVVYLNNGTGHFTQSRSFGTPAESTLSVAVGDVSGDGNLDIVAGNNGQNAAYLNDGAGYFSSKHSFGSVYTPTLSVALGNMDSDPEGHIDIVVGNAELLGGEKNTIFFNDGTGSFPAVDARSFGLEDGFTQSLVVGDVNGDTHLDIVTGNDGGQNAVYLNDGAGVFGPPLNFGSGGDKTLSVALGDMDGDGDLDIVAGDDGGPNAVYRNDGSGNFGAATSVGSGGFKTRSVALGDVDGDGDLDVVTGNGGALNRQNVIYLNNGAGSFPINDTRDFGTGSDTTSSVAVGDVDGDGDLDIITGDGDGQDAVFLNNGAGRFYLYSGSDPLDCGSLPSQIRCFGNGYDKTTSLAVGDVNGDGHLDIVAVSDVEFDAVYLNDGAGRFDLPGHSRSFGAENDATLSAALGDIDGDGDLDIVTGENGDQNAIYRNDGEAAFGVSGFGTETDATLSVAVGDVDGDAHLDIVVGNDGRNTVYLNQDNGPGSFHVGPVDCGAPPTDVRCFGREQDATYSIALGDIDGDGDLDVVAGNKDEANAVYLNDGAGNFDVPGNTISFGTGSDDTYGLATGDVDGDGDLDVVTGNYAQQNVIYLNDGTGHFSTDSTRTFGLAGTWTNSLALGDLDGDGDLDIVSGSANPTNTVDINHLTGADLLSSNPPGVAITRPAPPPNAAFYSTPRILSGRYIPIPFTLFDPDGDPVGRIAAYYSLDGGGHWYTATASSETPTTNLATGLQPTPTVASSHVFTWDTFASGVFGQSDNVVLRLEAYPQPVHTTVTNAYRYTKTVSGPYQRPYAASTTFPFRVRGTQIRVLSGTVPIANAVVYRLAEGQSIGGALLTDNAGRPYRTDALGYLEGRGTINIGDRLVAMLPISWTESYTIYVTSASPTALGLDAYTITQPGVQTLSVSPHNPLVLFNLDVSLEWDARNDEQFMSRLQFDLQRASEILYDWSNGQAALGQVDVYHDRENWLEAYIRIYASNRLRPSATQGGIVTDIITDPLTSDLTYEPGQIHIGAIWNRYGEPDGSLSEDWPRALAHEVGHYGFFLDDNYLGQNEEGLLVPIETCPGAMSDPYRVDDASGYDEFHHGQDWGVDCVDTLANRSTGRWDWKTITTFYPDLDDVTTNTGPSGLPLAVTQIRVIEPDTPTTALEVPLFYLTQAGGHVQPGTRARAFLFQGDWLIDLGRPTLDQVNARGARPDDRLCVYEPSAGRLGCETVEQGDEQLELSAVSDWQPNVIVSPVTSRTVVVTVADVPSGMSLYARLFPMNDPAPPAIQLTRTGEVYSGTVRLDEPALVAHVHVWVDKAGAEPRREIVTDYALGGNPGLMRGRRGLMRGRRGLMRGRRAPAVSADGQVILYGEALDFEDGEFYALQAATTVPSPPPWATVVGQAFWLATSADAPNLVGTSLSFNYLGTEVPQGEEDWLHVYYWNGAAWMQLPTQLDTYYNIASAPTQDEGLYALMSTIEIPLHGPGWNTFAYPVPGTRPVEEALEPIEGYFSVVYGYVVTDTLDPWKVFGPSAPDWVNDLAQFKFGHGYWIHMTESITLPLKGGATATAATLPVPPTTYYGAVGPGSTFTPAEGMTVTAWIAQNLCGQAEMIKVEGQIVYVMEVLADDFGKAAGCGAAGRTVHFKVGDEYLAPSAPWDNSRVQEVPLHSMPLRFYLPLVLQAP
jgi:hypothetical protein